MSRLHGNAIDITNHRYGHLVAIHRTTQRHWRNRLIGWNWLFKCDCGNTIELPITKAKARGHCSWCKLHRHGLTRHGMTNSLEYGIWQSMKQRCFDKNNDAYCRYGGRGITVCEAWSSSFEAFLRDMGPRPSRNLTIERINNSGNYEPGNCRWDTRSQQARNRRSTPVYLFDGKWRSIAELSEISGIRSETLHFRIKRMGMNAEVAVRTPLMKVYGKCKSSK